MLNIWGKKVLGNVESIWTVMFLHFLEDLVASFKGQSMLKRVVQLMFSISIGFSASWVDHINIHR